MFNRTFISSPDVHVHNCIEQKPHDPADAARLYGQLKSKAEESVLKATVARLDAVNNIRFGTVATGMNFIRDVRMVRILFSINGENYDLLIEDNEQLIQERIYEAFADKVTNAVLNAVWKK